jgi:hypothetical protein
VLEQALGFFRVDGIPDGGGEILLAQQQRQFVAFEIQLRERGFLFSCKTFLADGLDLADPVTGMVNGIAFVDGNKPSPDPNRLKQNENRQELYSAESVCYTIFI